MAAILKRVARPYTNRPVAFVDLEAGALLHEDGQASVSKSELDLARLLKAILAPGWRDRRPGIVYLVGGWVPYTQTVPATSWFEAVPAGWRLESYNRDPLLAKYRHETGVRVHLYMTAPWFGGCANIEYCQRAYVELRQLLRATFDQGATILATPARTGLDLLERSLPVGRDNVPYEYPVLDEGLREVIEHNVGQGRIEWLDRPGVECDAIYGVDANWFYASCLTRLPVGPVEHDNVNELVGDGYRPAFYSVRFTVPADWQHIGLLPVWSNGRPCWPTSGSHDAFVNGELVRLAREQGWQVDILSRWIFADEKTGGSDPARIWREKLTALRQASTAEKYGPLAPLLRGAIRSILLNAIGSWHRSGRYELVESPANDVPVEARYHLAEDQPGGQVVRWWRRVALDKATSQFVHPEWAAAVWLRAAARLCRAALRIPYRRILALRTDEILTTELLDWPDDGKPGTFRQKAAPVVLAGRPVPIDDRQYQRLRRELAREASHA